MGVSNLSSHFVFIFVHLFAVAILSSGSGTHFHGYLFGCSVISSTVIGPLRLKIFDHLDPDEHLIASSPSFVCICTLFLYWSLVIIPIKNNVVLLYMFRVVHCPKLCGFICTFVDQLGFFAHLIADLSRKFWNCEVPWWNSFCLFLYVWHWRLQTLLHFWMYFSQCWGSMAGRLTLAFHGGQLL